MDRNTSYVETDLIRQGHDITPGLPLQNVTEKTHTAEFTSSWTAGLEGSAYCMYSFYVDGFDRIPEIRYGWEVSPSPIDTAWIGLANWADDRWDFWQCNETGEFSFGDISDYTHPASSNMVAAVVVADNDVCELRYLRVGSTGLVIGHTISPDGGVVPITMDIDLADSVSLVGSITEYGLDYDGDGVFDEMDSDPLFTHVFTEGGNQSLGLRIENSYGEQLVSSAELPLYDPWFHTWGGDIDEAIYDIASDGQAIYAVGKTYSFPIENNQAIFLLKYGLDGTFEWARSWGGANTDAAQAISINGNGDIFTAGYTASFGAGGFDMVLQRWDSDGNVLWSRTWGGSEYDFAYGLRATGEAVYACGTSNSFLDSTGDAVLVAYDLSGELLWDRCFGGASGQDVAWDIQTIYRVLQDKTIIHVVGETDAYDANTEVHYATFDTDGVLLSHQTWGEGADASGKSISVSGLIGPLEVYIAGEIENGADNAGLLLSVGADPLALQWGGGSYRTYASDVINYQNKLHVAGRDNEDTDGFLYTFSEAGALERAIHWSDFDYEVFHGLALFPGSGFICGGSAYSPDGEWSENIVILDSIDVDWVDLPPSAYIPVGPVTGAPSQSAQPITDAKHDGYGELDYGEAVLGIVAQ